MPQDLLFPPDFLRQLEGLQLLARQLARGRMRGERRSPRRGAGLEFADYRPFADGDDIRAIDWHAYARSRHLVLKLFEQHEDLHVHLLLDASRSMLWGHPAKSDQARRIVAGLAYLAIANLDRAGITPLPSTSTPWSPARGRANFLRLLRYLEACQPASGPTPFAQSLRTWIASRPRRGLVIWVTDGWGTSPDDLFEALDRLRYSRHEVAIIQIRHAEETVAGELGEFDLEDIESGELRPVIVDRQIATFFERAVQDYETRLQDYCRRFSIPRLQTDAARPAANILQNLLHAGGFVR